MKLRIIITAHWQNFPLENISFFHGFVVLIMSYFSIHSLHKDIKFNTNVFQWCKRLYYFTSKPLICSSSLIVLHLSALAESVTAALLTLLLSEPRGSLGLTSCPVTRLEDWYSMLYNPSPNYTTTLHCTQEMVYPLWVWIRNYCIINDVKTQKHT